MQHSRFGKLPRAAQVLITRLLDKHAAVRTGAHPVGRTETPLGWVDEVAWFKDRVTIEGRFTSTSLGISIDGIPKREVKNSPFKVTLSRLDAKARVQISCATQASREMLYLAPPDQKQAAFARRTALPLVLTKVASEYRNILKFIWTGDPNISLALRQRLGLSDRIEGTYLPAGLFSKTEVAQPKHPPVIVIPVFNALEDIDRLLSTFPSGPGCAHHVVLVDDCSSDERVALRLANFQAAHPRTCTLIRHTNNLGFVASANRGLNAARNLTQGHVILLNSDAVPPENWVARILEPFNRDQAIASVTPMSNAAEILSIPNPGQTSLPSNNGIAAIDGVAQKLAPEYATAEIPTGVGFCMALNRRFLDRIPEFDLTFGHGYGEEVDWCQRIKGIGGKHVGIGTLFVGHRGGSSFGSVKKQARIRDASRKISQRYPTFDADVQIWCQKDPLSAARLALSIAWLGATTDAAVPIYFGHTLGGGAEAALQSEISTALKNGCPGVVIIRVGGPRAWRVDVQMQDQTLIGEISNQAQVLHLLRPLKNRKIIYSCGVGAAEPASVPRFLLQLVQQDVPFEIRLHDFFPISPSWNLLGSDGLFSGVPDQDCRDPVHRVDGRNPLIHRDWRLLWRAVIQRAQTITAFSKSSAKLLATAYPEARPRIVLEPHLLQSVPAVVASAGQNVGVLGSINHAKGGAVLVEISKILHQRKLVVIGDMEGRFHLEPPHLVNGPYRREDISELVRVNDIGLWLMPSICPETFSFTSHEALATGLPVLGFDLGAQGEALRAAANGHLMPYCPSDVSGILERIEAIFSDQEDIELRSAS